MQSCFIRQEKSEYLVNIFFAVYLYILQSVDMNEKACAASRVIKATNK